MTAFLKPVKAAGIIIRSNPVKRPCEAICTGKPNNSRIADGSEFTNAVDSFYRLLCRWKILEDAMGSSIREFPRLVSGASSHVNIALPDAKKLQTLRNGSSMILSIGADGKFAGLVVQATAARGARVRGLIHRAENADEAKANGAAEIAVADLRDKDSLASALRGVTGIFYLAPVFAQDESTLGLNLIEVAKNAKVKRFVFSSVIHPVLSLENHAAKIPVEAALYSSGMEFVVLHPAVFFQNLTAAWPNVFKTGVFAEPFPITTGLSRVDYRDVAEVAAIGLIEDRLNFGITEARIRRMSQIRFCLAFLTRTRNCAERIHLELFCSK